MLKSKKTVRIFIAAAILIASFFTSSVVAFAVDVNTIDINVDQDYLLDIVFTLGSMDSDISDVAADLTAALVASGVPSDKITIREVKSSEVSANNVSEGWEIFDLANFEATQIANYLPNYYDIYASQAYGGGYEPQLKLKSHMTVKIENVEILARLANENIDHIGWGKDEVVGVAFVTKNDDGGNFVDKDQVATDEYTEQIAAMADYIYGRYVDGVKINAEYLIYGKPNALVAGDMLAVARSKMGAPYVRGAKGPNRFDCSGFVYWVINQIGVKQSYLTTHGWRSMTKYTKVTDINVLEPGDIILFHVDGLDSTRGHMGIVSSNGIMIHSLNDVHESNYKKPYWESRFICAYRLF